MVFHWSLNDSKSPQVSRTLLSILVDFSNAVVWIVFTRPLIFKSPSPFNESFGDCTKGINSNWYNHHFNIPQIFDSLVGFRQSSFLSLSFNFTLWSAGIAKSTILQVLLFCWLSLLLFYSLRDFFKSMFAESLSQEFERQLVSSSLLDSSQYSGRSQ